MACTQQSDHHGIEEQRSWVPDLVCGGFVVGQAGQQALGLVRVLANDSPDGAASQGVAPPRVGEMPELVLVRTQHRSLVRQSHSDLLVL